MKIIIFLIVYGLALSIALARKAPKSRTVVKPVSRGWGNRLHILIIGATGGTGRQPVRQALELGHQVTAFVRTPARLKVEHPNLRIVKGNVLDYASLESAMREQNVVVCALGHKRWFYPNKILSEGTRNILRAMKTCDVPRLVCESSLGIGNSVGRLGLLYTFFVIPLILPFIFWDKARQEKLIVERGVDWVIVRPAVLTNGAARGSYRHGLTWATFFGRTASGAPMSLISCSSN